MDEADLGLVRDWLTRAHRDLRASLILAAFRVDPAPGEGAAMKKKRAQRKTTGNAVLQEI